MFKSRATQLQYQKDWYRRNHLRIKSRMASYAKQNKQKVWDWFRAYKAKLKCENCIEDHPACLQFHHKEPANKSFAISTAVRRGLSIENVLAEIAKCSVLCANCHAKHHALSRKG